MNDQKNNNLKKCYNKVSDSHKPCGESSCRHFLKSEMDLNCSIIAADSGPKTLQEIGDYYGISRMRVCQIEKTILKKLRKDSKPIALHNPSSS
jgi:hypothetical protein